MLVIATQEHLVLPQDIPIRIVNPRNDIELGHLYQHASVFLFSSWSEGFGLPPLEAMACGVPVVTTACGGVEDFAHHEENCLLVPPRQPHALYEGMQRIKSDPALAQRLSQGGLATGRSFTFERALDRMEQVLAGMDL